MLQLSVMIWPSCALTMAFSSTAFTGQMKLCTLPFICASKSALKSSTDVVCVGSKGLPSPAPEACTWSEKPERQGVEETAPTIDQHVNLLEVGHHAVNRGVHSGLVCHVADIGSNVPGRVLRATQRQ